MRLISESILASEKLPNVVPPCERAIVPKVGGMIESADGQSKHQPRGDWSMLYLPFGSPTSLRRSALGTPMSVHLEAGLLERLLADLVDLLRDVVVVRVVVDELERLVGAVAGVGEHLLGLGGVAVALAVHLEAGGGLGLVVEVTRDLRRDDRAGGR